MTFDCVQKPSLDRWVRLARLKMMSGSMLIYWPIAWVLTMSAYSSSLSIQRYVILMFCAFFGAILSHRRVPFSTGCVWNDILDRNLDRHVERSKDRPIASGEISVPEALVFLGLHLAALLAIVWSWNKVSYQMSLVAIFFLPAVYPLMKRITYWPQAWLGIAVNYPALCISVAISPKWTTALPAAILVLSAWSWTIYYDTIYACQDKRDDVKAGVKSTAVLFGGYARPMLTLFAAMTVASLVIAGFLHNQGLWFFVVAAGGGALHLIYQLSTVDLDDPQSCWACFEMNSWQYGGIIWAGLFLDYAMRTLPLVSLSNLTG